MDVGIIGGGMMGLSTAYFLSQQGVRTEVFEKEREVGGLSRSVEILPGTRWDQYYHAILSTDHEVLQLLEEIGLGPDIRFTETKTGFFSQGGLHSMSNSLEFLTFKPLSLWSKFRLGLGILYSSRLAGGRDLEKTYAKAWLIKVFGRRNYEKLWDPLLRSKFGSERRQASALLIWSTIKRYYGTRQGSGQKETMGYVPGGYSSILRQLRSVLGEHGGAVVTGCPVTEVRGGVDGKVQLTFAHGGSRVFDKVIATVPNPEIEAICPELPSIFRDKLHAVRYLGLVCLTLLLKKPLSPFYVLNLTDPGFPFTGVIETTNHIDPEEVEGYSLVYLPRYLTADDPFFQAEDTKVFDTFLQSLKEIFPELTNNDIVSWSVNREKYVQPLLDINYSQKVAPMQTPVKNFHMVNTSMILDSNLNNNRVIALAREMSTQLLGAV